MLIRWATAEDLPAWLQLADQVAVLFGSPNMAREESFLTYTQQKVLTYEALIAVDRRSGRCLGIISFSRTNNCISWMAVSEECQGKGVGTRLLSTALRQIDNTREITVETFGEGVPDGIPARKLYLRAGFIEVDSTLSDQFGNPHCKMSLPPTGKKRGGSFHYNYPQYEHYAKPENCPCCNDAPMPKGHTDLMVFPHSIACAERTAQGRLFGKCYVLMNAHHVDFEEIPFEEMAGFMSEVQQVGKALHKVTGAVKINYEIHANSAPHIHCHLFPRYLDDDFPSAPIDYHLTEPSPYESDEEFEWFVEQMKMELASSEVETAP